MGRVHTLIETYDKEGDLVEMTYPSGAVVAFTRDAVGDVTQIRRQVGGVWTVLADQMSHRPYGPLATVQYGDGITQTRTLDQSYRLTRITDQGLGAPLRDVSYGFDLRDNLTTATDHITSGNAEAFTYAPREQLASASGPYGSQGYAYDGVGNRTVLTVNGQTSG